jgi:7-cyano-7-deazaguanine synthase
VVTGVCGSDTANYPDCRPDFILAFSAMAAAALGRTDIKLYTPLLHLNKAAIVKMARGMPECWEAMAYTHTGYDGNYPPVDNNHANVLRAKGFEEAGYPDPLVLRAHSEGLMELPSTANYDVYR